jgi:ribonuclease P/MRP protein subunit POP1
MLGKRKEHPNGQKSDQKRRKFDEARDINVQTLNQAFIDGQLDVNQFVKAREYEIKALEDGLVAMRKTQSARAFQQVPRNMRRRTASHNVARVPRRLRDKAKAHVSLAAARGAGRSLNFVED